MPKNRHQREESREGHLRLKSAVSQLLFPLGGGKKKEHFELAGWNPTLSQGKKIKNERKKACVKVMEPP